MLWHIWVELHPHFVQNSGESDPQGSTPTEGVFAGGPLRVELDEGSELSGGNVVAEVSLVLPAGLKEEAVEKMRCCVKV